jgi:cell division protein FtsB
VRREAAAPVVRGDGSPEERIAQLEAEMGELRREMAALRQKIDDLFGD